MSNSDSSRSGITPEQVQELYDWTPGQLARRKSKFWSEGTHFDGDVFYPDAINDWLQFGQASHMSKYDHTKIERVAPLGVVYFVRQGTTGPIKIGFTTDVDGRLKALQTANPYELIFLGCIEGTEEDERNYHEKFAAHRIRGEWFEPDDEITSLIDGASD